MAVINHVSVRDDATGTAKSATINAKSISWITNEGANTITFNFDDLVTATGAFRLPAGATINDLDLSVSVLRYICTAGSTDFSLLGIAR